MNNYYVVYHKRGNRWIPFTDGTRKQLVYNEYIDAVNNYPTVKFRFVHYRKVK